MGICDEKSGSKVISDTFSYTLGLGTCDGHMSERKHHKKEKQLILDSYTNRGKMANVLRQKGCQQQVKSEHKAVPLQLSAPLPATCPWAPLVIWGCLIKSPLYPWVFEA